MKIIVISNMENHFLAFQQAHKRVIELAGCDQYLEIIQISDQEIWNKTWQNKIKKSTINL